MTSRVIWAVFTVGVVVSVASVIWAGRETPASGAKPVAAAINVAPVGRPAVVLASAPQPAKADKPAPAAQPKAAEAPKPVADETLKNPLLEQLRDLLGRAEDIGDEDRQTAREILNEADGLLTRVRDENRAALKEMNRQVRIKDCRSPNIVLFLLDDVGGGDLGCYGQEKICTPCLDAVAEAGTRFTQFYGGSGWSVPSRGTWLSGRLTARGQLVGDELVTVRESDVTVAEMLYRGGYDTALYGVWGAGPVEVAGHPVSQGFQRFLGYLSDEEARDYYPESLWLNRDKKVLLPGNEGGGRVQYAPDLIVEEAKKYIAGPHRRPFFLTVALPMEIVGDGSEVPDFGPYANTDWPVPDKTKAALLTRVDGYVGDILRQVLERSDGHNTLVIITGDNGPDDRAGVNLGFFDSTGGLRGRKGDLYEGGIRVPMIVRWSGPPLAGPVCELPWAMWDVLPTLADLTSTLLRPQGIDGVSLVKRLPPTAPATKPPPAGVLYWEKHRDGFAQAARSGDWKAIRFTPDGPWALYDLCADPGETTDVASQHPDIIDRMNRLVDAIKPSA